MTQEVTLKEFNESNEESKLFRLFFLKDDEEKSVEIMEVEEIDFIGILRRLESGQSIFISPKQRQRTEQLLIQRTASEKDPSPWYFAHI